MKQFGKGLDSLEQGLVLTTIFGFASFGVAREAYYRQDGARAIDALIAGIGTCIFAYNTVAIGLYGDISYDYTCT
jgi:hypothetical protein